MAEFAKCHICRALMVDDPDDRREHLGKHADSAKKIEAQRVKVNGLLDQIAALRDQVKGYGQQLEQHPISAAPESIVVNEMPDDEIDEFEDDLTPRRTPTTTWPRPSPTPPPANPSKTQPTTSTPSRASPPSTTSHEQPTPPDRPRPAP
jgi:hypothetical protein